MNTIPNSVTGRRVMWVLTGAVIGSLAVYLGSSAGLFDARDNLSDDSLERKVLSAIRRGISHPAAVHVIATNGQITLIGDVLADEVDTLLATVGAVSGVKHVSNQLSVYATRNNIPTLHS